MLQTLQSADGSNDRPTDEFDYASLDRYIDSLTDKRGALIPVLHKAQSLFGYLPVEVQSHIALKLDIPSAKVFGVVTFYSFFTMKKKGEYKVDICLGTACFVRGAQKIADALCRELNIKVGEVSEDGLFSLDALRCVGACGLAPVVSVNGKVYGRVTEDDVKSIVEEQMVKDGERR
ncbi:MAG: NAD(P)H-dependent oxidoreductase subunit E [Clostridiales bacterium]|jgi:NADH:ubiquinone oxidoreductase subunit E|nr:NAD(P)H-dependent oxidoreductase subunit E [Clostridiales bacterium]